MPLVIFSFSTIKKYAAKIVMIIFIKVDGIFFANLPAAVNVGFPMSEITPAKPNDSSSPILDKLS